jgi:hypothetical protein
MSDDEIEEMVRDGIYMRAEDKEACDAVLQWLDKRLAICAAVKELGLCSPDDLLDTEAAA